VSQSILVTGSEGLVGSALVRALTDAGFEIVRFDRNAPPERGRADVRDPAAIRSAVARCAGIVHLAAVSRVIWGERDPRGCWETNVGGTQRVLEEALQDQRRPWVLFASSREIYGQPDRLPASEDTPIHPVNIYGRSKAMGERLVNEAQSAGLRAAIVRLSNVYGSAADHADRVVPAFARAAVLGEQLRVEGVRHTFDFTHLDDTVRGLLTMVEALQAGERRLPPIHLLTGVPTTLGELAALAVAVSGRTAEVTEAPPRSFDVSHFYGCPLRANEILGWEARVGIRDGLTRLIDAFRARLGADGALAEVS
jgi:nucleoside-diphosphate-sugar epimerase